MARRLRRNEVLVHQGEPDRAFHIVRTGNVHAVRQGRNGRSLLLDVLGPGSHFGERGLIDEQPRETTVRCAQATELLTVQGPDFRQCLAESHAMCSALLRTLSAGAGRPHPGARPAATCRRRCPTPPACRPGYADAAGAAG